MNKSLKNKRKTKRKRQTLMKSRKKMKRTKGGAHMGLVNQIELRAHLRPDYTIKTIIDIYNSLSYPYPNPFFLWVMYLTDLNQIVVQSPPDSTNTLGGLRSMCEDIMTWSIERLNGWFLDKGLLQEDITNIRTQVNVGNYRIAEQYPRHLPVAKCLVKYLVVHKILDVKWNEYMDLLKLNNETDSHPIIKVWDGISDEERNLIYQILLM